jgi:hypothetical protein
VSQETNRRGGLQVTALTAGAWATGGVAASTVAGSKSRPPRTPGEMGPADMRIIAAIDEAARTGRTVSVGRRPPVSVRCKETKGSGLYGEINAET